MRELASGGMGTVCLAREVALDRLVAVKVLQPELYTADAAARFEREAQILAKLHHPNIVVVHKVDQRHGLHFYVLEYLEGDTLQARLVMRGRLTQHDALKLGRDLLEALEVAHRAGVIHRDVKPSNVFWIGRRAVLTDFGIAKQVRREALTDPHFRVGTAPYMAPELFSGIEANESSDLYAAAMVIYEAFTGRRWEKDPPAKGDWSAVSRRVMRVLARALQLDPKDRWSDAGNFRRRLWRTRIWPYQRNAIAIALGFTALGLLLRPVPPPTLHLSLEAAKTAPNLPAWLGDSVTCGLAQRLSAPPWSTVSPTRSPRCCTGPRSCSTPRCRCSCCRRPPTVGSRCSAPSAPSPGAAGARLALPTPRPLGSTRRAGSATGGMPRWGAGSTWRTIRGIRRAMAPTWRISRSTTGR